MYQGAVPSHMKERRLPDGAMSLVINLRDDLIRIYDQRRPDRLQNYRGVILCSARSELALLDTSCLTETLAVQFRPGGAYPFLAFPADELHKHEHLG